MNNHWNPSNAQIFFPREWTEEMDEMNMEGMDYDDHFEPLLSDEDMTEIIKALRECKARQQTA